MTDEETIARRLAAQKMGLVHDTHGSKLPDDLWQQMLPAARSYLDQLGCELYSAEYDALLASNRPEDYR